MNMKKILAFLVILLAVGFSIYPVIYILGVSLRPESSFSATGSLFANPSWIHYRNLFTSTDLLIWVRNSLVVSIGATIFGLAFAATCGYGLARAKFRARKKLLGGLLLTQMFPPTMLMLPFFLLLTEMQLMDSFLGLFLIYSATALPFCIWQMKAYFETLPVELEEAAAMDGATPWQIYWKVVLPLAKPALAITAFFSFVSAWSEFAIAAVVLQNPELYTLPLGLTSFQASLATEWGLYAAAAVLVSLPVMAVFLFLTRYLISGLTLGGVKG